MLRATVLLCLVTSAVLTQSLPTAQYNGPTDDTIVDYHTDSNGSINDTLSAVPNCTADYTKMSGTNPKMILNNIPKPFGVCVRADGCFVAILHVLTNHSSSCMTSVDGSRKRLFYQMELRQPQDVHLLALNCFTALY